LVYAIAGQSIPYAVEPAGAQLDILRRVTDRLMAEKDLDLA
jgi:hypothetical protein